jgi:hypothetical protein
VNRRFIIKIIEQLFIVCSLQFFLLVYLKSSVIPSFFLVWLMVLTWDGNIEIALLFALITGILHDIFSHGILGTTSICFLILVYLNSFLKLKSILGRSALVFFMSIIYFLVVLFKPDKGFLWTFIPLAKYSLIFAFYNSVIFFLIEWVMRRYRWKWKKDYLGIP